MARNITLACITLYSLNMPAQSGALDPSFDPGAGFTDQFFSYASDVAIQDDGRIVCAGNFDAYQGIPRNTVARLFPDGTLDATFDVGVGPSPNGIAGQVVIQPDGRLIAGGGFTTWSGSSVRSIVRLHADGGRDMAFGMQVGLDLGEGDNGAVHEMMLQPDGKILVAGMFNSYDGHVSPDLVRLDTGGFYDTTFQVGSGFAMADSSNSYLQDVDVQTDGKIIALGNFDRYNGMPCGHVVRLHPDGTLDDTFQYLPGLSMQGTCLGLQSDGRILLGGVGGTFNGQAYNGFVRVEQDGSIDPTFSALSGFFGAIYDVVPDDQDRILLVGQLVEYGTFPLNGIARLDANGVLDTTFTLGGGTGFFEGVSSAVAVDEQGRLVVVGQFTSFNGVPRPNIARLFGCAEQTFYMDADGDGSGSPELTISGCAAMVGYVLGPPFDCDDADSTVYPLAPCDDGDTATVNDTWNEECDCVGELSTGTAEGSGASPDMTFIIDPATNAVLIRTSSSYWKEATLEVFDAAGRVVLRTALALSPTEPQTVNLPDRRSGCYLLRVTDGVRHEQQLFCAY